MLVLTRRAGESLVFPELGITVFVAETRPDRVRLGVIAPPSVRVFRDEILQQMVIDRRAGDGSPGNRTTTKE